MRKIWLGVLCAGLLQACDAPTGSATVEIAPIAGRVLDATSRTPVANAVVVATVPIFDVAGSNLHEGTFYQQVGDLSVREATTDADGQFVLPREIARLPDGALISSGGVQLMVYAKSYDVLRAQNDMHRTDESFAPPDDAIESAFNGRSLQLTQSQEGDLSDFDRQKLAGFVQGRVLYRDLPCRIGAMPVLVGALERAGHAQTVSELRRAGNCRTPAAMAAVREPVYWQSAPGGWELVIDADQVDMRGAHATPSPFTGPLTWRFAGEAPAGEAVVVIENVANGQFLNARPQDKALVSEGDRLFVRIMDMGALLKPAPAAETAAGAQSLDDQ